MRGHLCKILHRIVIPSRVSMLRLPSLDWISDWAAASAASAVTAMTLSMVILARSYKTERNEKPLALAWLIKRFLIIWQGRIAMPLSFRLRRATPIRTCLNLSDRAIGHGKSRGDCSASGSGRSARQEMYARPPSPVLTVLSISVLSMPHDHHQS